MKEARLTWRFWLWGFVFLFLAHAAAVFRFAERNTLTTSVPAPRPFFYLSLDEKSDRRITELTGWRDPTLFGLPHARGFSGGAWLNFRPEIPKLSNWSAPPEWLPLPLNQLGDSLRDYVATNQSSEERLLSSLRPPTLVEVRLSDEPLITNTTVRIEGPLAARKLIVVPPLPDAFNADVLRKSVVAVSVNGEGVVESAWLAGESGSRDVDDSAVKVARQFAFAPAPLRDPQARTTAPPTFGRLLFTWHVITNLSVAASPL